MTRERRAYRCPILTINWIMLKIKWQNHVGPLIFLTSYHQSCHLTYIYVCTYRCMRRVFVYLLLCIYLFIVALSRRICACVFYSMSIWFGIIVIILCLHLSGTSKGNKSLKYNLQKTNVHISTYNHLVRVITTPWTHLYL